jgi:ribose/xylose/arabinose/galactoside ABC-type transport system permease subunit
MTSPQVKFQIGLYAILAVVAGASIGAAILGGHIAGYWGLLAGVTIVMALTSLLCLLSLRRLRALPRRH